MGPKGKSGQLASKNVRGRKRRNMDEQEGEGKSLNTVVENPQPDVDVGVEGGGLMPIEDNEENDERTEELNLDQNGKKNKELHDFTSQTEQLLVEYFAENDCFYNKGSDKYANTQYKNRLLENLASQLKTTALKITKWLAGQRSTVGKLLQKPKSGSKAKVLTARQKWQLANFGFLKEYIKHRSHSHDTGQLPVGEDEDMDDEDDDELERHSTSSAHHSAEGNTTTKRMKGSATGSRIDEALLKYLQRPRTTESLIQQIQETGTGPLDDKKAFSQWLTSKMMKIPEEHWDAFEDEAQNLVKKYTRLQPTATMNQPNHHQPQPSVWQQPTWVQAQQPLQQSLWSQPQQQVQNCPLPPIQQWASSQPQSYEQNQPPSISSRHVLPGPIPQSTLSVAMGGSFSTPNLVECAITQDEIVKRPSSNEEKEATKP